jgi:hypothetical protein
MQICVSSWENPSADPEIEAFRGLIGDYVVAYGKSGEQYRIKSKGRNVARLRRVSSARGLGFEDPLFAELVVRLAGRFHDPIRVRH